MRETTRGPLKGWISLPSTRRNGLTNGRSWPQRGRLFSRKLRAQWGLAVCLAGTSGAGSPALSVNDKEWLGTPSASSPRKDIMSMPNLVGHGYMPFNSDCVERKEYSEGLNLESFGSEAEPEQQWGCTMNPAVVSAPGATESCAPMSRKHKSIQNLCVCEYVRAWERERERERESAHACMSLCAQGEHELETVVKILAQYTCVCRCSYLYGFDHKGPNYQKTSVLWLNTIPAYNILK
jgi:hypothetical protein